MIPHINNRYFCVYCYGCWEAIRPPTGSPRVEPGAWRKGAKMILQLITVLISVPAAIVALIELVEKALRLIARLEWRGEAQD